MKTTTIRQWFVTVIPAILMLIAIAAGSVLSQTVITDFTRDLAQIGKIHPLSGILSSLGIFVWCVSASICLFSFAILRKTKKKRKSIFLLSSSLLSAYLMFDDAFLFHEELARRYLGISENIVFLLLAISLITYLIAFRKIILKTQYELFLFALVALSLSVVFDTIFQPFILHFGPWKSFVEDSFKWLGIVSWCSYYVSTSYRFIFQAYSSRDQAVVNESAPQEE